MLAWAAERSSEAQVWIDAHDEALMGRKTIRSTIYSCTLFLPTIDLPMQASQLEFGEKTI